MLAKTPKKPRYKLADLMAEMPAKLPKVNGWDELSAKGREWK